MWKSTIYCFSTWLGDFVYFKAERNPNLGNWAHDYLIKIGLLWSCLLWVKSQVTTVWCSSYHFMFISKNWLTPQDAIENMIIQGSTNRRIHLNVEMSGWPIKSGYHCKLNSTGVPQTKQSGAQNEEKNKTTEKGGRGSIEVLATLLCTNVESRKCIHFNGCIFYFGCDLKTSQPNLKLTTELYSIALWGVPHKFNLP